MTRRILILRVPEVSGTNGSEKSLLPVLDGLNLENINAWVWAVEDIKGNANCIVWATFLGEKASSGLMVFCMNSHRNFILFFY